MKTTEVFKRLYNGQDDVALARVPKTFKYVYKILVRPHLFTSYRSLT